jgi:hypothetical protein
MIARRMAVLPITNVHNGMGERRNDFCEAPKALGPAMRC